MRILFKLNTNLQQRQHEKSTWIFPIHLAMYATALRNQGHEVVWTDNWVVEHIENIHKKFDNVITSEEQIDIPFLKLPHADRLLTDAKNNLWQKNGNFKYHPGCYLLSAKGCSWGKCSFCVENGQKYEVRPVEDVISEIEEIKSQGYKEVFDDSATFPTGKWLEVFSMRLRQLRHVASNKSNSITFSCNMRIGVDVDYEMMKQAGFRMLLFGLESANQKTLDKINKGVDIEKGIECIKKASRAGLEPHIAVMFGYSWESDEDAIRTLKLVHYLLRKGFAKTAQASFFNDGTGGSIERHRKFVSQIYGVWKSPSFWFNQLKDIRDINDIKYLWRKIKAGLNL
jgi:radical SAM superfamily enzyme YgiQ (UPF0313 family)